MCVWSAVYTPGFYPGQHPLMHQRALSTSFLLTCEYVRISAAWRFTSLDFRLSYVHRLRPSVLYSLSCHPDWLL